MEFMAITLLYFCSFLYSSLWGRSVSFISSVTRVDVRQLLLEVFDSSISCHS